MKLTMMATAAILILATSLAFATENTTVNSSDDEVIKSASPKIDSDKKNPSAFEDFDGKEKMENLSEKDKQLKGAGAKIIIPIDMRLQPCVMPYGCRNSKIPPEKKLPFYPKPDQPIRRQLY